MKNPFSRLFHRDRRKEYRAMQNKSDLTWYQDEIRKTEHMQRINMVSDIDSYLLREHKVLQRPNFNFKDKEFQTAKIILQTVRTIVNFHSSYTIGNQISFTGDKELVELIERVYRKGQFAKQDYEITTQLIKYGNAWEYIYLQDNKIKSKVFINDECYPCYDDKGNYYAFIEYWRDKDSGAEYHTIYYPDRVESYIDNELVDTNKNLTGLPIHYKSMVPSAYTQFGEPFINDLIPIIDQVEQLLSRLDDAVQTLSMNPIGVLTGLSTVDEMIDSNMVGACVQLADGDFKYATVTMDHANIKQELDSLLMQFYGIACVPASVLGQSNVANVSEVSLSMLFNSTDNVARQNMFALKEGFAVRWEYMRKLLALQGTPIKDELFDTLDCSFNVNRPVDTESAMKEMLWQRNMGAISKQTIIENSKHTPNTALELERIKAEEDDRAERVKNAADLQGNGSGDDNPSGGSGESKENVDVKTPSV